jgi:hypothetical protein
MKKAGAHRSESHQAGTALSEIIPRSAAGHKHANPRFTTFPVHRKDTVYCPRCHPPSSQVHVKSSSSRHDALMIGAEPSDLTAAASLTQAADPMLVCEKAGRIEACFAATSRGGLAHRQQPGRHHGLVLSAETRTSTRRLPADAPQRTHPGAATADGRALELFPRRLAGRGAHRKAGREHALKNNTER